MEALVWKWEAEVVDDLWGRGRGYRKAKEFDCVSVALLEGKELELRLDEMEKGVRSYI